MLAGTGTAEDEITSRDDGRDSRCNSSGTILQTFTSIPESLSSCKDARNAVEMRANEDVADE